MADLVDIGAVEILEDRLFFLPLRSLPPNSRDHYFSIDNELVYWNFFLDFGPLNMGQLYRFCRVLDRKLVDERLHGKRIVFFCGTHPHRVTNAACLLASWLVLTHGQTPEQAMATATMGGERGLPLVPFHDATQVACTYDLTVLDCVRGLYRAKECGFFDFEDMDVDELEQLEQVENGDLHWICKKFIAFAGPHDTATFSPDGYCTLTPEHYTEYFTSKGVEMVVRLNKPCYEKRRFERAGLEHRDMFFVDGTTPPNRVLKAFMAEVEGTKGAVAVHCKAGLGRTGCLIGAYLMKHFHFTAAETIGWLRLCRPGMVIGPQQHYLESIQDAMWKWGDLTRTGLNVDLTETTSPPIYGKKVPLPPPQLVLVAPTSSSPSPSKGKASVSPFGKKMGSIGGSKVAQFKASFNMNLSSFGGSGKDVSQGDKLRLAKSSPKARDSDAYVLSTTEGMMKVRL